MSFGIKAGTNFTKIDGQSFKDGYKLSFQGGLFMELDFNKKIGIQPEFLFSQIKSENNTGVINYTFQNNEVNLNYLSIPILFRYKVAKILVLNVGPQYSFLLNKSDNGMLDENFAYGMVSRFQQHNYISLQFLEACYKAGDTVLAGKVTKSVKKELEQQMTFYAALGKMSVAELQQGIAKSSQMRYQQERDEYMANSPQKLRSIYDDAERGYQFLKAMENFEQQFKNPKPINNTVPVQQPKTAPVIK